MSTQTDAQYDEEIAREQAERRAQFITGLRAMADFLEENAGVDLPYSICGSVYAESAADARRMTHLTGTWTKTYDDYCARYGKTFTPPSRYYGGSVRLEISVQREQVCQRVEVGTKHVEARVIEAHDEPVYEWICTDANDNQEA